MVRMTVRMAAMRSNAAESRVRHLSVRHIFSGIFSLSWTHLLLICCFPAQAPCFPGQPSCISTSCPPACGGGNAACNPRNNNCSESSLWPCYNRQSDMCEWLIFPLERSKLKSETMRRCLPLVVTVSLCPSSLWTDQPGAVYEPTLQPDQLPQLPRSPVPERERGVLGVLAVPCPGPDRMLPVPHVLCLHTAGAKVWSTHPTQGPSLQVSSSSVSWEIQMVDVYVLS